MHNAICNLTKRYGAWGVLVSGAISLEIRQGEVLGVFGPNGAGKTALVRQMGGTVFKARQEVVAAG
ncbi:ATP-binding cassette domain-containing protein [Meiothermus sp.]|uniref:ATP-binding cassette domain-containing protein n=1 Tax=Meiothermus sp. TaxID=1955249 RepID=UPI0035B53582